MSAPATKTNALPWALVLYGPSGPGSRSVVSVHGSRLEASRAAFVLKRRALPRGVSVAVERNVSRNPGHPYVGRTFVQAKGIGAGPLDFYVTVIDGPRTGFLLGPYYTHGEALANVERGRRLAESVNDRAMWYAYGTASAPHGTKIPTVFPLQGRAGPSPELRARAAARKSPRPRGSNPSWTYCGVPGCAKAAVKPDPYGGKPVCLTHYRELLQRQHGPKNPGRVSAGLSKPEMRFLLAVQRGAKDFDDAVRIARLSRDQAAKATRSLQRQGFLDFNQHRGYGLHFPGRALLDPKRAAAERASWGRRSNPLLVNLRDARGGIGPAAALMQPDDFYVRTKLKKRDPRAVAFLRLKAKPKTLYPIYSLREAIDLVHPKYQPGVGSYLRTMRAPWEGGAPYGSKLRAAVLKKLELGGIPEWAGVLKGQRLAAFKRAKTALVGARNPGGHIPSGKGAECAACGARHRKSEMKNFSGDFVCKPGCGCSYCWGWNAKAKNPLTRKEAERVYDGAKYGDMKEYGGQFGLARAGKASEILSAFSGGKEGKRLGRALRSSVTAHMVGGMAKAGTSPFLPAVRRNPLDTHKPGCRCIYHSGRMGRKNPLTRAESEGALSMARYELVDASVQPVGSVDRAYMAGLAGGRVRTVHRYGPADMQDETMRLMTAGGRVADAKRAVRHMARGKFSKAAAEGYALARRNPLDSHKPGCRCIYHSGRMGRKNPLSPSESTALVRRSSELRRFGGDALRHKYPVQSAESFGEAMGLSEAAKLYAETHAERRRASKDQQKAIRGLHEVGKRYERYGETREPTKRKRNPLDSHKPGCRCIYHSGRMGRRKTA